MATKKPVAPAPEAEAARRTTHGYDGAGHMDPKHAAHLLALGRQDHATDDNTAFINATSTDDDLAENLAEAAVRSMTSGEDELTEKLEAEVTEETGGPFTETSANTEFAGGTDDSNIAEATREPFPTANRTSNR
jgi:hypothetical protein